MPQLAVKPLSWFKVNSQVRKQFDEADLLRLGESLKQKQLQPVLCQPDGTLIAGERRYRAAKLVGLATLEVKIADEQLAQSQISVWQLQENLLREDLKPIEQVDGVEEVARLNPEWINKEISQHLHLDPSMVTRLRAIAHCFVAKSALAEGRLKGISDAYAVAKAPVEQKAGLLALVASGASRDQLEESVRKARAPSKLAVRLSRAKVLLPSGVSIVVSGAELSLEELIEALSEAGKEARKARDQGLDVKTFGAVMRDKAKAGG